MTQKLLVIAGPTAVGKTNLSINLAKHFGTVIVSADSRQCYREITIGTAKPTKRQLEQVDHFFIDHLSIHDNYTVADYEKDVLKHLNEAFSIHDTVILTGGSGLFIKAVIEGFDPIPNISPDIRHKLNKIHQEGKLAVLQKEIQSVDPLWAATADLKNPRRVIRALEVFRGTGLPISHFQNKPKAKRPFEIIYVVIEKERDLLYHDINHRADLMIKNGLFDEAKTLFPYRNLKPLKTVGYQEIHGYMEGRYDREQAIFLLKRNTRRYARRQTTWFSQQPHIQKMTPQDLQSIIGLVT